MGNTLKAHDIEMRRLQSESHTLRIQLETANAEILSLRDQLSASASPAGKPANKESLADPEKA